MRTIKTEFSNIDIFAITKELDKMLREGTISNIYQVEDIFIFKINTFEGNKNLIIKKDSRINITNYEYPIPQYPSQYVISLRKFIRNRKIAKIYQYNFDRIAIIELYNNQGKENWKLIIELFGKGNFILVDENNKTLVAKSYRKMRNRNILAQKEYDFPMAYGENFLTIEKDKFKELFKDSQDEIVRIIARKINISGLYSEEVCYRSKIEKNKSGIDLSDDEIEILYKCFKNLRNEILFSENKPHLVYKEEKLISVLPFELEIYKGLNKRNYKSFNEAVDVYFSQIDSENLISPKDQKVKKKIEAQEKILKNQMDYLEELKNQQIKYYHFGDEIYSKLNLLNKLHNIINEARNKGYSFYEIHERLSIAKEEDFPSTKFYSRIIPSKKQLEIKLDNEKVLLDISKSIGENANLIYSKGKKARDKIEGTKKAIEKTKKKIRKLEEEKHLLGSEIDILVKTPQKMWYEKYHWFFTSDEFLVIGGRDASSNEAIYRKYLQKRDLIFHTTFPGSPLTILKNPDEKEIPKSSIEETAIFVASYSQAWKENWRVADIFYVSPEQVSKTPPSGEFLPKGSFMIEGQKNFIKNTKTELRLGIKFLEQEPINQDYDLIKYPQILCGPSKPIDDQTEKSVIILPSKSGYSKGELAKKIKSYFIKTAKDEEKPWFKIISTDEIILRLPNGLSIFKES
ncbi:MAG: ribosome rescue protein RqcH [Candidatus Lokiarchaeota archaeon]